MTWEANEVIFIRIGISFYTSFPIIIFYHVWREME